MGRLHSYGLDGKFVSTPVIEEAGKIIVLSRRSFDRAITLENLTETMPFPMVLLDKLKIENDYLMISPVITYRNREQLYNILNSYDS